MIWRAVVTAALLCAGCAPARPIKTVSLEIENSGDLKLNGNTISRDGLVRALEALSNPNVRTCVGISAQKTMSNDEIQALEKEVQKAGITCMGASGIDQY